MSLATGTGLGLCEVLAQIGAGGMGKVYESEDLKLHRHFVLNRFEELQQKVPTGKN